MELFSFKSEHVVHIAKLAKTEWLVVLATYATFITKVPEYCAGELNLYALLCVPW